jgi:hypothetical protein
MITYKELKNGWVERKAIINDIIQRIVYHTVEHFKNLSYTKYFDPTSPHDLYYHEINI